MRVTFCLAMICGILLVGCGRQLPEEDPVVEPVIASPQQSNDTTGALATESAESSPTEVPPTEAPSEDADDEDTEPPAETPEEVSADEVEDEEPAEEAEAATISGDAEAGAEVFNLFIADANFACTNCHSVDEGQTRLVGPGLWGIEGRAGERLAASGAADITEYVRLAIVAPNDYIVDTYPENLMPAVYTDVLTDQQVDDLIAYIFSLDD